MRLYLVRHGKAADDGYRFDEHRPLTDDGRERMRRTAKAWAKRIEKKGEPAPDLWLASPLVRAVQTAEICLDAFGQDGPCEITSKLAPDAPISAAASLFTREGHEAIAVVSHEPLMSTLASHLTSAHFPLDFKKGAVLALERDAPDDAARFVWYLTPAKSDDDPEFDESL